MRCLGIAVLALVPATNGQSVQSMQMKSWSFSSFGGWSSMRSSSSSVAWGLGSDGQMHEEVHRKETSKTFDQDASIQKEMHSKMNCIDGLCQKQTVGTFGGPTAPPARMQRVLDLMGIVRSSPSLRGGGAMPGQAAVLVVPRSAPAVESDIGSAVHVGDARSMPQQLLRGPLQQDKVVPASAELYAMQLAASMFAGSLLLAGAVSALVKYCGQRSQAREVSLCAALAEPLAADSARAPVVSAGLTSKADSVKEFTEATARDAAKTYLASLYSEATMPTKDYLIRVYANALA